MFKALPGSVTVKPLNFLHNYTSRKKDSVININGLKQKNYIYKAEYNFSDVRTSNYMAARRYEISLRVLKNMRTSEIFSTREEKFRMSKQLKCSMGRRECHKRDAYHVGKHSQSSHRSSCARVLACFSYFSFVLERLFRIYRALLEYMLSNSGQ